MLFPAQSIGVDQPSLHSSGQLSHHGTKSRRLEAKVSECCRIRIKCGCPGFSRPGFSLAVRAFHHINRVLKECLAYYSATWRHISLTKKTLIIYES